MPELPEVETIKNDLSRLIIGKRILKITTDTPKLVKPSLSVVKKAAVSAKIIKIKRRAKFLQIFLNNKNILGIHLKMSGRLLVRRESDPPDKWQHVILTLTGKKELRFCDLRKFGWVKLLSTKELKKILADFGPEPLDDLNLKTFQEVLNKTRRPIKVLLMDQKKISGIGNIYANDALFLSRIDPRRPANKITESEAKNLFLAIEKVLKAGIKYRGASDQYYLDALGHRGSYQDHFLVYGRTGKKCFNCKGQVKRIKLGGRGTFFCPNCQK